MPDYDRSVRYWDEVYRTEEPTVPRSADTGIPDLTAAQDWLCEGAASVLDFGCGNGTALMWCALRGVRSLCGIDLSAEAIHLSEIRASRMLCGQYDLRCGSIDALSDLPDSSRDAVILMNVLDNLYPEDGYALLSACARLLKPGGRALITLNPYLSQSQIKDWNIRVMDGNLLDDGLPLYNLTDEAWQAHIASQLSVLSLEPLVWPGQDRPGRLLRASKAT